MTMINYEIEMFQNFVLSQIAASWFAGFLGVITYKFYWLLECYESKFKSEIRREEVDE